MDKNSINNRSDINNLSNFYNNLINMVNKSQNS